MDPLAYWGEDRYQVHVVNIHHSSWPSWRSVPDTVW